MANNYKVVFSYDPETLEYLNSVNIQENPKRPGEFLIPPKNTMEAEPKKCDNSHKNMANSNRDDWVVVADYRGKEYYLSDGSHHKIEKLGEIPPEDALDEPPPPSLNIQITQKLQSINSQADALLEPITSNYPKTEVVSWDKQEIEARRWQEWKASKSTDSEPFTPLIDQILVTRTDISKPDLIQRVITKADAYSAYGQIFGIRHNLEKQLEDILANEALTDDEKREAINGIDEQQAFSVVNL